MFHLPYILSQSLIKRIFGDPPRSSGSVFRAEPWGWFRFHWFWWSQEIFLDHVNEALKRVMGSKNCKRSFKLISIFRVMGRCDVCYQSLERQITSFDELLYSLYMYLMNIYIWKLNIYMNSLYINSSVWIFDDIFISYSLIVKLIFRTKFKMNLLQPSCRKSWETKSMCFL